MPGWRIGKVPNGGYVLAIAGRVLREALKHPDPLSVHIMYTAPTVLGPVECQVQPLRAGGSTSYASLSMHQEGELKAFVSACYTELDRLQGESWSNAEQLYSAHGCSCRDRCSRHRAAGEC